MSNLTRLFIILLFGICLASCNKYYLAQSPTIVKYYTNEYQTKWEDNEDYLNFIVPNEYFLFSKANESIPEVNQIVFGNNQGYVGNTIALKKIKRISKKKYVRIYKKYFSNYDTKSYVYKSNYFKALNSKQQTKVSQPKSNDNNNYNTSHETNSGGKVQVKGYYRKDGTYVRPHTRSAPRRR